MRKAEITRNTSETQIALALNIDGSGKSDVRTGIGFLDHMLTLFARHGLFDLTLQCTGDLQVDEHHTVEDIGIVLGQALARAMGDKCGIRRYAGMGLPMDETLVRAILDVSGRPYLVYDAPEDECVQLYEEFFRAFAFNAGITLHVKVEYGRNAHHIVEAMFKAVARCLRTALEIDPRETGVPSTKGVL